MKFRTDFVTNSSSSSFITVNFKNEAMNEIMRTVVQKHVANQELRYRICSRFNLSIYADDEVCEGDWAGYQYGITNFSESSIFDNLGYLPDWFIGCYRSLFFAWFTDDCSYYDDDFSENIKHDFQTMKLGTYPQNANGEDRTPIEWFVLKNEGDKALLISKYALDVKSYHERDEAITWEKCSLRAWLNGEFFARAFNETEQERILPVTVTAEKNPESDTDPGNDTVDRVFLLSIQEAEQFFKDDDDRSCGLTDFAKEYCADYFYDMAADGKACCWWWLRSPGADSNLAACTFGPISEESSTSDSDVTCVRPCVWVRILCNEDEDLKDDTNSNADTGAEESDPRYVSRENARVIIDEFAKEVKNNWGKIQKQFEFVHLRSDWQRENETMMRVLKIDGDGENLPKVERYSVDNGDDEYDDEDDADTDDEDL